jgi:hypothetical protein
MNAPLHGDTGEEGKRPSTSRAHPRIYTVLIALTVWFVIAIWSFAGAGVTDYLLVVVSGFIFAATTLSLILFRVGGRRSGGTETSSYETSPYEEPSFRDWVKLDYETWGGRLTGAEAATQILLPIAAAAVGMTLIGIIFLIAEHNAA